MLSGAMRWDVLHPWRPFGDRFVLSAGHTVPLIYATLATLNEAMRLGHERTGDPRFAFPHDGKFALTWEDLLLLRRNGGFHALSMDRFVPLICTPCIAARLGV